MRAAASIASVVVLVSSLASSSAFQPTTSALSRKRARTATTAASTTAAGLVAGEIEVCQNKHCRKQGSSETLQLFQDFAASTGSSRRCSVSECGCIGDCGKGPNVRSGWAVAGQTKEWNGVVRPATAAAIMAIDLELDVPDAIVEAYELHLEAAELLKSRSFAQSDAKSSAALDAMGAAAPEFPAVEATIRIGRAEARTALNEHAGAIEDAQAACDLDAGRARSWWALRDANVATGDVAAALDTLYSAVEHVPSLRNMAQADAAALCSLEQEAPPPQCRVF